MKKMIKLAMAVALTAFAVACSNQEDIPATNENEVNGSTGPTEFSIEGIINGYEETADSRAEAQTVVRIHWQGNETVYVYDGTACIGSLTAQPDENNAAIAKLSGTLTDAPSGTKPLTLVYSPLFGDTAPTVNSNNRLSLNLSTQNTSTVPFLIYGVISNLNKGVENKVVNFQLATSVYKCNAVKLTTEGTISQATIDHINTKCVLKLSDTEEPTVYGDEVGTITLSAGFTSKENDERAIFAFALPKSQSATERTITVTKDGKEHTASFSKSAIAPAKSFNSVYAFKYEEPFIINDYVEIAGVRWATMNLGATTVAGSYETCVGDVYQWGSLNTIYDTKTLVGNKWRFTWKSGYEQGFAMSYLEYTDKPADGVLPNDRDVVMKMTGNAWRMPELEDFRNLIIACIGAQYASSVEDMFYLSNQETELVSSNLTGGVYNISADQTILPEYEGVAGKLFVYSEDPTKRVFFPYGLEENTYGTGDREVGKEADYHLKNLDPIKNTPQRIFLDNESIRAFSQGPSGYHTFCGLLIRPVQDVIINN